jgi:hypothetical protein
VNPILDDLLVAAALLVSLGYALFALGPRALRRRALSRIAGWAGRGPSWLGLSGLAARVGSAAAKPAGSCGGCDGCASDGKSPSAAQQTPGSASEIKIPLASVGRRQP